MLYTAVLYRLGVFKVGYMIRFGVKYIIYRKYVILESCCRWREHQFSMCRKCAYLYNFEISWFIKNNTKCDRLDCILLWVFLLSCECSSMTFSFHVNNIINRSNSLKFTICICTVKYFIRVLICVSERIKSDA